MSTVHNKERLNGVHPSIRVDLVDAFEKELPFDVLVAPNGGLRTDEKAQAATAASGMSNATTLKSTPHGRAAAGDFWPVSFLPFVPAKHGGTGKAWVSWEKLPQKVRDEFAAMGAVGERHGYEWGGRFKGKTFPNGDQPHYQMKGWQLMPFPPPKY